MTVDEIIEVINNLTIRDLHHTNILTIVKPLLKRKYNVKN